MKKTHWRGIEREREREYQRQLPCMETPCLTLKVWSLGPNISLSYPCFKVLSLSLSEFNFFLPNFFFLFFTNFSPKFDWATNKYLPATLFLAKIFACHSTLSLINLLFFNYFFSFHICTYSEKISIPPH